MKILKVIMDIVFYILAFIAIAGLLVNYRNSSSSDKQTIINIDTTIINNYYWDTTTHQTLIRNITYPTEIFKIPVYLEDSSACDSIREYQPEILNDSIEFHSNILVHGKLLDFDLNYKFKFPQKEIITTITKEIHAKQKGLVLGTGIIIKNNRPLVTNNRPQIALGVQIGFLSEKGNLISYNYNNSLSHSIYYNKIIEFKKWKIFR